MLAPAELAALHEAIDGLGLAPPGETIQSQRFSDHLPRAVAFQHLIDHPAVFDIVVELCGVHVRLDHAYGIVMAPGTSGLGLHGGATPFDPTQYYLVRDGKIRCGLVAVQWALVDHPAGGGGFCGVPGSHKASFALPERPDSRLAVEVPLAAGDLVVFTEALTHGTLAWRGPEIRRTLLYKYSPGSSTWARTSGGRRRCSSSSPNGNGCCCNHHRSRTTRPSSDAPSSSPGQSVDRRRGAPPVREEPIVERSEQEPAEAKRTTATRKPIHARTPRDLARRIALVARPDR